MLLFVLVAVQSSWVQLFHAQALDNSPINPRNNVSSDQYDRGGIYAANGAVLARSIATSSKSNPWRRIYPFGSLTSNVVGFTSSEYGDWYLEVEYNKYLESHREPPQSFEQLLAPSMGTDSLNITLEPALQQLARTELAGRDGSVVVLDPRSGAVLALYSNPTFNPKPFTSVHPSEQTAAWKKDNRKDADGYPPLGLVATEQTIFPGSTFKIVTTAGIVKYKPSLLTKRYPSMTYTKLPDTTNLLHNDGGEPCGGTVAEMLPSSCDPGYGLLGLALGAQDLTNMANAFGFNEIPPLYLPGGVLSFFPKEANLAANPPFLAYSAIGQEDVSVTALQDALVAAAIANDGIIMTPHLMNYISSPEGKTVIRYKDSEWKAPLSAVQAATIVPLMEDVVKYGTAAEVGFLPADDVAAKTGTAQVGDNLKNDTDDWMIAFAPADDPTVAIAVSVPFQTFSATGAEVAGPITKCLIEGTLALQAHLPVTGTATTCPA